MQQAAQKNSYLRVRVFILHFFVQNRYRLCYYSRQAFRPLPTNYVNLLSNQAPITTMIRRYIIILFKFLQAQNINVQWCFFWAIYNRILM